MFLQDIISQYVDVAWIVSGDFPLRGNVLVGFVPRVFRLHEYLDMEDGIFCRDASPRCDICESLLDRLLGPVVP